jgi:hypothetical protein
MAEGAEGSQILIHNPRLPRGSLLRHSRGAGALPSYLERESLTPGKVSGNGETKTPLLAPSARRGAGYWKWFSTRSGTGFLRFLNLFPVSLVMT